MRAKENPASTVRQHLGGVPRTKVIMHPFTQIIKPFREAAA
jgi:hypothetical protein